ncbi:MAG: response regulator [Eubacteriales bacterium]|nr:response regulator [Eubacteriales bacterium]
MRNYHILLVDDEEIALLGLKKGIDWEALGIGNVFCADSMKSALEVIRREKVDLMISDIEMPGGSGLELIQKVRQEWPDILCVFYTCHADFYYCQEAIRAGALDYVLKPIPYEELEGILRRGLQQIQKGQTAKELENIWGEISHQEEKNSAVKTVKKMITENLSVEISRDELAAAVFMSPDHLTKLFKKETGMSLSDYIIQKRLLLAQQLLTSTDLSIVEIASRAGFSYSSYFVRIFKKKLGITPQQYRKEQSGKEE